MLVLDRYEIGEQQTSACGIPTEWLRAMGLEASARQEFGELVVHTPHGTSRYKLPWTFSTFDYRELCILLWEQADAEFETAKVNGRTGEKVHTDRGDVSAPLIVDALGWRRILASDGGYQPPDAPLSRGLEVHPHGGSDDLEIWIDRRYVPAGYGWRFPARDEQRIGVGSFDPRFHVKDTTNLLADELEQPPERYQGNWIPHKPLRDRGRHLLRRRLRRSMSSLTAEGIRTAFYFGIRLGDELRAVIAGRQGREAALRNYGEFVDAHEWKFRWMLRAQRLLPKLPAHVQRAVIRACGLQALRRLGVPPLPPDRPAGGREPAAPGRWRAGPLATADARVLRGEAEEQPV